MTQPTIEQMKTAKEWLEENCDRFRLDVWYDWQHMNLIKKIQENAIRAALTAQAVDGNRLPLEEVPIGVQFNSLYKSIRGDKYCSILKDVHNGEIRLFYGNGQTPAEALRAAIAKIGKVGE